MNRHGSQRVKLLVCFDATQRKPGLVCVHDKKIIILPNTASSIRLARRAILALTTPLRPGFVLCIAFRTLPRIRTGLLGTCVISVCHLFSPDVFHVFRQSAPLRQLV